MKSFKDLIEKLDHIDPMPWNQAIIMGVAVSVLIIMAFIAPN